MSTGAESDAPELPLPIFRISASIDRYMLYDINTISWLRKEHHILGVLIGTLPQAPQQNVFLGLPLELMSEEACLLSKKGIAYVVDDNAWHRQETRVASKPQRESYLKQLEQEATEAAQTSEREKLARTEKALRKLNLETPPARQSASETDGATAPISQAGDLGEFFATKEPRAESLDRQPRVSTNLGEVWAVTPPTTGKLLSKPPQNALTSLPAPKSSSFALFEKLHENGYYMSPGLRFGCEFMAYPGDPLRYHSHFLAVSADWDEEFDLLDLVGGGRLGTGVKKGFLIGGVEPDDSQGSSLTRTFCIEWGGM